MLTFICVMGFQSPPFPLPHTFLSLSQTRKKKQKQPMEIHGLLGLLLLEPVHEFVVAKQRRLVRLNKPNAKSKSRMKSIKIIAPFLENGTGTANAVWLAFTGSFADDDQEGFNLYARVQALVTGIIALRPARVIIPLIGRVVELYSSMTVNSPENVNFRFLRAVGMGLIPEIMDDVVNKSRPIFNSMVLYRQAAVDKYKRNGFNSLWKLIACIRIWKLNPKTKEELELVHFEVVKKLVLARVLMVLSRGRVLTYRSIKAIVKQVSPQPDPIMYQKLFPIKDDLDTLTDYAWDSAETRTNVMDELDKFSNRSEVENKDEEEEDEEENDDNVSAKKQIHTLIQNAGESIEQVNWKTMRESIMKVALVKPSNKDPNT